jgi:hypothetical protein
VSDYELIEVEQQAREAAKAGDNGRAASICLQGIDLFGEEVCTSARIVLRTTASQKC